jgi:glycosyltransferase involved in cell wall biosynthesis
MSRRDHVALFLPSLAGGGAERVMLLLAGAFAARGLTVDLVVACACGPYASHIPAGVRLVDLGTSGALRALPALVRYLRAEHPPVLLSALDNANLVALWARWIAGVKTSVLVSVHSQLSNKYLNRRLRDRLMPWLLRRTLCAADAVVAVSRGVADDVARVTGVPCTRIHTIHNPVVPSDLDDSVCAPVDDPFFAPSAPPVVLGVGRLVPEKDFATLLQAFARVRAQRDARLLILGEGPERQSLEALAVELGIAADIHLPGFKVNPFAYMRRARVFALSSVHEGFGNVLAEALATGTAVVSTDCPSGPAEILEHGRYGALCPVGQPEMLANAILKSLDAPEYDADLASYASARFGVDVAAERYLTLLRATRVADARPHDSRVAAQSAESTV